MPGYAGFEVIYVCYQRKKALTRRLRGEHSLDSQCQVPGYADFEVRPTVSTGTNMQAVKPFRDSVISIHYKLDSA